MIAEALKFLAEQAVQAKEPQPIHPTMEPPHCYWLNGMPIQAHPMPRDHKAFSLQPIIDFAVANPDSKIWYSRNRVTCLVDDSTRRDRVTLTLRASPQLMEVTSWGNQSKPFSQHSLILMLRTMFRSCLSQAPKLIDSLRAIRFSNQAVTNSTIKTGKASVGRSIESEVTGVEALPDEFLLDVPVWDGFMPGVRARIWVALDMDAAKECFTLHPVPGDVEANLRNAEDQIGMALSSDTLADKCFYGEA